jgi:DNA-binding SARP family transcriptional activator
MRELHIRLLGEFLLDDSAAAEPGAITPRLQSLLAYLVLHRDAPQPRQHLAFLLWPDSSETRARTSLRQLLFDFRAVVPAAEQLIRTERLTIQWWPDPAYITFSCDADIFQQNARADSLAALRVAVDTYRGDLLPGLYDEWMLSERERLRRSFWATLDRLITLLEARCEYAEAISYAERQIQEDPLHEPAYERLIRLQALMGSRAGAIQVYHQCASVLRRELDAEPGPALQAAHVRLLAAPKPDIPQQRESNALIGRTHEWTVLREIWQRMAAGQAQIVVLIGEPGVGKTRLAEELVAWAARQGIVTASARCYADETDRVYAPVTAWLRSSTFYAALAKLDQIRSAELTRILPELLANYPNLTAPGPLTERWQQAQFRDALVRALLSQNEPLLLFLDDMQWCDPETLTLLPGLLRSAANRHLLVIATLRAEELPQNHPIIGLRPALQRDKRWIELALSPLAATDTTALAAQAAGQPVSSETAARVYRETEGNPLFVVEFARAHLREDGPADAACRGCQRGGDPDHNPGGDRGAPRRSYDTGPGADRPSRSDRAQVLYDIACAYHRRLRRCCVGARPGRALAATHHSRGRRGGIRLHARQAAGSGLRRLESRAPPPATPAHRPGTNNSVRRTSRCGERPNRVSLRARRRERAGDRFLPASGQRRADGLCHRRGDRALATGACTCGCGTAPGSTRHRGAAC